MNDDTPVALLTGVAAATATVLGVDRFPDELPDWLGFLILVLGAGVLIGQVVGRALDEFGPPRPQDRYERKRTWVGLASALGGILGALVYVIVAAIVVF